MSNPMAQLIVDLTNNIKSISPADATEFSNALTDAFVACSTYESYLTGIAETQYVHCISRCLETLAYDAQDTDLRPFLWHPIVASLLKCISSLANREPYGFSHPYSKPPGVSSSSLRKLADSKRTPDRPGSKKPSSNTKSTPKSKDTQPNVGIPAVPVKTTPEQGKGVPMPSTKCAKVDPQARLAAYQQSRTARSKAPHPFFKQLKGGNHGEPVQCKVPECAVCEKYFTQIPLTRCVDIRCHRTGPCTPSGWYPHVLPHIWASIKKAHTKPDIDVRYYGLPDARLPPLEPPRQLALIPMPKKRSWAKVVRTSSTDEDDHHPAKISSPMYQVSSPEVSLEPWSQQVDEDCGPVRLAGEPY